MIIDKRWRKTEDDEEAYQRDVLVSHEQLAAVRRVLVEAMLKRNGKLEEMEPMPELAPGNARKRNALTP